MYGTYADSLVANTLNMQSTPYHTGTEQLTHRGSLVAQQYRYSTLHETYQIKTTR